MSLAAAANRLAAAGDADATFTVPIEVGIQRWTPDVPQALADLGLRCGLERVKVSARGVFMAAAVEVRGSGPAPAALRFIEEVRAIVEANPGPLGGLGRGW